METDAFPLVGGGTVARPHEVSDFYPPSRIADRFKHDDFASIYLRGGKASSASDFLYLLDELNAYSHDLATAVDLKDLKIGRYLPTTQEAPSASGVATGAAGGLLGGVLGSFLGGSSNDDRNA